MLKRPFKSLIARIAIIALALSLVVPFVPAAFAAIGDDAGERLRRERYRSRSRLSIATDEDDDPIEWSLNDGADAMKPSPSKVEYSRSRSLPDFEAPA